ncbi:MAG: thioredoxin family protein [Leptospiraceae bacterium]|nr:thioredoxin family protein [Leptospiraceae bacterium]
MKIVATRLYQLPVLLSLLSLAYLAQCSEESASAPVAGQSAPDFTLVDVHGQSHTLSQYKGKHVVLEWINFDCPYVRKHYQSGNMQKLQREYTDRGIIWLAINSSAPGKQGHFSTQEIEKRSQAHEASFTAYLLDEKGQVGRLYSARTTPHMYVIDPEGKLVYSGAIDDRPTSNLKDVEGATNYVQEALEASIKGKKVKNGRTRPYGCSVKYGE